MAPHPACRRPTTGRSTASSWGPGVGSCGSAAYFDTPVFVSDIATDPRWVDFRDLALEHGLRACWSIPIRSTGGATLGTFAMYHREVREPLPEDLEIVDFVVRTAGVVIERSNAESAIHRSEARYRQIVEGTEDFAIITFGPGGVITGWNTGATRVIGYTASEAIGQPGDFFYRAKDREAGVFRDEVACAIRECRATNERWHLRKDGTRFWGSGLMMPLAMDDGGFVKIFQDRTAQHHAEAAILESEARLRFFGRSVRTDVRDSWTRPTRCSAATRCWPPSSRHRAAPTRTSMPTATASGSAATTARRALTSSVGDYSLDLFGPRPRRTCACRPHARPARCRRRNSRPAKAARCSMRSASTRSSAAR